jgi:hypothetical protein
LALRAQWTRDAADLAAAREVFARVGAARDVRETEELSEEW